MNLIILLGLGVLFIVLFAIAASNAPYGWEDEDGFHFGKKE